MATTVDAGWAAAQEAVAAAAERLVAVLRSATTPGAPALGSWDVTDVAVHLTAGIGGTTALVQGSGSLLREIGELGAMNGIFVAGETERRLDVLADRIAGAVSRFLGLIRAQAQDAAVPWLVEGTTMPLSGVTCQVLSELLVHGRDIAAAVGSRWPIDRHHASMVLTGFLFPSLGLLGRTTVDQGAARGVRATYEVRLRGGGGRAYLAFDDGDLTVGTGRPGPVDCHLSVDPATFLLVSWGRLSQWSGIARGRLVAYGRKPWLGLKLRSLLTNP